MVPIRENKSNLFIKYLCRDVLSSHWIDAVGGIIKLRPCAVSLFRAFVMQKYSSRTVDPIISDTIVHQHYVSSDPKLSKFPAEVVFQTNLPMYPVKFLCLYCCHWESSTLS